MAIGGMEKTPWLAGPKGGAPYPKKGLRQGQLSAWQSWAPYFCLEASAGQHSCQEGHCRAGGPLLGTLNSCECGV